MQLNLRIAIWNANGLSNHTQEIELFLKTYFIDILLVSETHFTSRTFFKIRGFDLIIANQPHDNAHAGSAILIKSSINYKVSDIISQPYLQAVCIKIKSDQSDVSICSIYFPPRFKVTCENYKDFFSRLGPRFLVGGDFNAKHPWWGSRVSNPKGIELRKCIVNNNYSVLSTGSPTYWPTDPKKKPDLMDFIVYSGISSQFLNISNELCDELNSDHSPILLNFNTFLHSNSQKYQVVNKKTDFDSFRVWIERNVNLNMPIKSPTELDDVVETFNNLIHEAGFLSTPEEEAFNYQDKIVITAEIREMIQNKRRLRKIWQTSRNPNDKKLFNRSAKDLKKRLFELKNEQLGYFLKNLGVSKNDEFSLWKATKYLKRPTKRNDPVKDVNGTWCKTDQSKAEAFASHLQNTFQPHNFSNYVEEITSFLDIPCPMDWPIKHISPTEVQEEVNKLNCKKTPGYDSISGIVAKSLPKKGILFLTLIFNSILRLNHFPSQWKCAEIIMVNKPNKPENVVTSYRPISLLVTFSKIFERIFISRLSPILEKYNIIPEYQFGFRHNHGTPEQCHRIVAFIRDTLENKKYCSGVFLDVQQAFDKVWHNGLFFKLKKLLPTPFYLLLKSYLSERHFYVRVNNETSQIYSINAGVPQGSVLGPILYTIFTSDMPTTSNVLVATYADDTAILASSTCPVEASNLVQNELNQIDTWLSKWNIKVNTEKSVHVAFTLRKGVCPSLYINNSEIPQKDSVKYLGLHIDKRLTWKNHIKAKKEHLKIKTRRLYWLLGPTSQLNLATKVLIYKTILKPVWTYGIQLWGTASNSNIEILQRYQNKTLRSIVNAQPFVSNKTIHNDLFIPKVKDEINRFSANYLQRLSNHCNPLAISLLDDTEEVRRLKRHHILDLPFR